MKLIQNLHPVDQEDFATVDSNTAVCDSHADYYHYAKTEFRKYHRWNLGTGNSDFMVVENPAQVDWCAVERALHKLGKRFPKTVVAHLKTVAEYSIRYPRLRLSITKPKLSSWDRACIEHCLDTYNQLQLCERYINPPIIEFVNHLNPRTLGDHSHYANKIRIHLRANRWKSSRNIRETVAHELRHHWQFSTEIARDRTSEAGKREIWWEPTQRWYEYDGNNNSSTSALYYQHPIEVDARTWATHAIGNITVAPLRVDSVLRRTVQGFLQFFRREKIQDQTG